jgi:ferrous iron transport protein A
MTSDLIMQSLDLLKVKHTARVVRVNSSGEDSQTARQLEEIGFIPGEKVEVLNKAFFGGDPLVVRVGLSTFALRKAEARLIEIGSEH